jgi:hypothetical protein
MDRTSRLILPWIFILAMGRPLHRFPALRGDTFGRDACTSDGFDYFFGGVGGFDIGAVGFRGVLMGSGM